ncbi:TetR/AcrR family transcriptional regulator [Variovorax paradoxus]|uniref:TetR/AcrR family transcriptional regulator n=1 Tax=Variovorax paradoxus TaxID=34073 RepID=UPI0019345468|nr:TetR/AcrR family transcriptional regulator [Variovorax paradoxus]
MNSTTKRSSPKIELRAESQRQRILKAATECFIQDGLHAGTIARISEAAQMSPGLIYRYFSSKEEIVLALMHRQISTGNGAGLLGLPPKVVTTRICEYLRRWLAGDPDVPSATLILEMSAESTRNEAISRQILKVDGEAKTSLTAWLGDLLAKSGAALSEHEIAIRVLTLECFVEGLLIRAVREPTLDMELVEKSMDNLMATLVPLPAGNAT